jgi:hypothetical protein
MPQSFHEADSAAVEAQRNFTVVVKIQIACLVVPVLAGTIAATFADQEWLSYVALIGLIMLAGTRLVQRFSGQESIWHSKRAIAEYIRSLSWQYAVGGLLFESAANPSDFFGTLVHEVAGGSDPDARDPSEVTDAMVQMRAASFALRRQAFMGDRLKNQRDWYRSRSGHAGQRGKLWDALFIAASAAAVLFGTLHAFDVLTINLLSVFGITAAVIGTWTGVKQFGSLEATYSNTAAELDSLVALAPQTSDEAWSTFVTTAEEVLSRELRMWRVKRT